MSDPLPDYYAILEVAPTATSEQIRTAYKKAALKWHPDRVPTDSDERPKRTRKFQAINDAYYTLSEAQRRKDYDEARAFHGVNSGRKTRSGRTAPGSFTPDDVDDDDDADYDIPRGPKSGAAGAAGAAGSFWSWFTSATGADKDGQPNPQSSTFADDQFGRAFEDMLHEDLADGEGENAKPNGRFWALTGTLAGATLGFIIANVPGAAAGGAAGNRLGHLRDVKGQSVYSTFQELPQNEKGKLLSELAAKIFAGAIS